MKPASYHLTISRRVSARVILQCLDNATPPQPVNLTGYTVISQARTRPTAALAFTLPWVITNAAQGELSLDLAPTQTAALSLGRFEWDLLLQHTATGHRYGPFIAGDCIVQDLATQPAI
jgi:hypothetical protein